MRIQTQTLWNTVSNAVRYTLGGMAFLVCLLSMTSPVAAANSWSWRNGPDGGYIYSIAVDPVDPNTVYTSTYAGIFKTTDGGANWTNLNTYWGAGAKLLIDPQSHTTIYAVSGMIVKSVDGGANWTVLNTHTSCTDFAESLVIDPKNSNTLYVIMINFSGMSINYYVIKSTDGGTNWNTLSWKASALAVDPTNSNILYASLEAGLQRSADGGANWSQAQAGLPGTGSLGAVVVDPKTPATLYVVSDTTSVYKSINSGGAWTISNSGVTGAGLEDLVIDPVNPNNLYLVTLYSAGTNGTIFKTTNAGGQWSALNLGLPNASPQCLALASSLPTTVYAGTMNNGVLRSTDSGTSWGPRNNGLKAWATKMALDPTNKNNLFLGINGLGIFQSTDGGYNWVSRNSGLPNLLVQGLALSPVDPKVLYVSLTNATVIDLVVTKMLLPGIYKSMDGGLSWSACANPADNFGMTAPSVLIADPINANGFYALSMVSGVYKSTDGGSSWTSSNAGLPTTAIAYSMAVDPVNPSNIYLGMFNAQGTGSLVYRSTDGGTNWSSAGSGLPAASGVNDIAIDPKTPSTLYAAVLGKDPVNGGVYKSTNSGGSWTDANNGISNFNWLNYYSTYYDTIHLTGFRMDCQPGSGLLISAYSLAVDPVAPSTLFAVVDGTVFRSTDGAANWAIANDGMLFMPNEIAISAKDHSAVYAASLGVFVYNASGGGGGGTTSLTVNSPNGGESWTIGSTQNITWSSTGSVGNVKIEISTDGGSNYTTLVASTANTGSYSWTVPNTPSATVKIRISDLAGTVSAASSANFTISSSAGCTYTLSLSNASIGASAITGSLNVTAGSGCAWTVTSNSSWVTIAGESSGSGNGTVNYSVNANGSSSSRTGTLTVAGQTFTLTQAGSSGGGGDSRTVFVPILLSLSGAGGSFYTTELTFTNRGSTTVQMEFTYVAAFSSGNGTATDTLAPGQTIRPDAIAYLKGLGIPIPDSGNRGGTLRIRMTNLSASSAAGVTARTATLVKDGNGQTIGRAGLAYVAIPDDDALNGAAYICGLRQNSTDRSNVAFQNMGSSGNDNITLRVTVFDGASSFSQVLPDIPLGPGQFNQIGNVLTSNGLSLTSGYIKVERVSGTAPYYAYGVINDQANSDGSFITPQPVVTGSVAGLSLPVIVQTTTLLSEVVLTNTSTQNRTLNFAFADTAAHFSITLAAGQQQIIPDIFQYMRDHSVVGIGGAGTTIVGALFATPLGGDASGVVLGARTSFSGGAAGGRFGLFYSALLFGQAATESTWLFGLQQNSENRTNLALVNTGETDTSSDTFIIDLYDGATGTKVKSMDPITLGPHGFQQVNVILTNAAGVSQGYAQIRRTSGNNPFIAYAVINDGAGAGLRTGDGAYIGSHD